MAHLNQNTPFVSWDMTPQEVLAASMLTTGQRQHVQNIIASYAMEKLQRKIDPINPIVTIQQDAESAGQISALQYLLDLSDQAEAAMRKSPEPDPAHGY